MSKLLEVLTYDDLIKLEDQIKRQLAIDTQYLQDIQNMKIKLENDPEDRDFREMQKEMGDCFHVEFPQYSM